MNKFLDYFDYEGGEEKEEEEEDIKIDEACLREVLEIEDESMEVEVEDLQSALDPPDEPEHYERLEMRQPEEIADIDACRALLNTALSGIK